MGVALCHVIHFLVLRSNHIIGVGKADHFKSGMAIDTGEYLCTHDRLLSKGMCSGHVIFVFLEITDNISAIVKDRDIVVMKD